MLTSTVPVLAGRFDMIQILATPPIPNFLKPPAQLPQRGVEPMRLCIMLLGRANSLFRMEISLFGQEKFPVRLRREPGYNYLNLLANLMQKLSRQAGFLANSLLVSLLSGNWGPAESGSLTAVPGGPMPSRPRRAPPSSSLPAEVSRDRRGQPAQIRPQRVKDRPISARRCRPDLRPQRVDQRERALALHVPECPAVAGLQALRQRTDAMD